MSAPSRQMSQGNLRGGGGGERENHGLPTGAQRSAGALNSPVHSHHAEARTVATSALPVSSSYGSAPPSVSSSASVFDLPGHSLYLSDPHRLSVLSLTIDAATTITPVPPQAVELLSPGLAPAHDMAFDHPPRGAPSSASRRISHNTAGTSKRSSFATPDSVLRHGGSFRPKSVEIGLRAREAFNELGRRAREAAGNLERSPNVDALSSVTRNLNPDNKLLTAAVAAATEDVKGLHSRPRTLDSNVDGSASVRVRRRTTAKLQSLTFGRDSRLTSPLVPLDLEVHSQVLTGSVTAHYDGYGHYHSGTGAAKAAADGPTSSEERLASRTAAEAIAFVADPSPRPGLQLSAFSAAGSESREDATSQAHGSGGGGCPANQQRLPFDPMRLLLKVEPPAEHARDVWAARLRSGAPNADSVDETHQVDLRFRLRLCASAEAQQPSNLFGAKSNASASSRDNRMHAASSASPKGLEEVLFVSADSSQKLADAIDMVNSALSSAEAAALEGVVRVVVNPARPTIGAAMRGARDCDFEWTWRPMQRRATTFGGAFSGKGHGTGKCCCAFVELDAGRIKARVLAAFAFWIEIPPTQADNAAASRAGQRTPSVKPSDSVALIAALNFDIDRADLFDGGASTSPAAATGAGAVNQAAAATTASTTTNVGAGALAATLKVNHTEISLEDIESDSPILRAAIANLDRRTSTLKKLAKTALKAAHEARVRTLASIEADNVLDDAMRDLSAVAPDTLLKLREAFGGRASERATRYRREQAIMLEQNIERPLSQIVEQCRGALDQIKNFDAESKSYYSHTQKWLSSRVVMAGSTGYSSTSHASTNGGERIVKQERADEKQKVRQLRFDYARLDLYRVLGQLHGGQAELELVQCVLRLSQWQASAPHTIWGPNWPGSEVRSSMAALSADVKAVGSANDRLAASIKERSDEVLERIRLAELSLRHDLGAPTGNEDPESSIDLSANIEPVSEQDYGGTKGAKQAGQKLRNFFGGLNLGKQGSSSGLTRSQQASGQDAATPAAVYLPTSKTKGGGDQGIASGIRRKVSLKVHAPRLPSSSPAMSSPSVVPTPGQGVKVTETSPWELLSMTPSRQEESQHTTDSPGNSRAAVDLPKSPLLEHVSTANEYLLSHAVALRGAVKPSERRADRQVPKAEEEVATASIKAEAPSTSLQSDAANVPRHQGTSSTAGLGIGGLALDRPGATTAPAASVAAAVAATALPEQGQPRTVLKQVVPGQDRKKEGVLWVMSKPVSGPVGADAPRAVNRAGLWRECWVVLSGSGHICEYADWKDAKILEPSNPLIDLRFATVRDARGVDRRFAFEVVTRDSRRFFQAPDEATMRDWTKAIAKAIESLLNGTSSVRKLDRAVRATPFKLDLVLQHGPLAEEGSGHVDNFGALASWSERESLGKRPFSQSMTDLTGEPRDPRRTSEAPSAFGGGISSRGGGRRGGGGHTATLSESYTVSAWKQTSKDDKPKRSASKHERGISNKTPIYGYLGSNGSALGLHSGGDGGNGGVAAHQRSGNISEGLSNSSYEADFEFDRRIEEIVQSSFGKSSIGSSTRDRDLPASPSVSEMDRLQSSTSAASQQRDGGGGKHGHRAASTATSTKMSRATEIIEISHRPENALCADCRTPDPRWASWALGNQPCCIFICISCSGVHRSLGVHISKVKSVDLDDWSEEQVEAARRWDNVKANELWEHNKPAGLLPVDGDRQTFWRRKYIEAIWRRKPSDEPAQQHTPSRTPRTSAPAAMATTSDHSGDIVDRMPTKLPKLRSASSSQAPPATTALTNRDEASAGPGNQTSPKPSGPRPLPPSRSSSFADSMSSDAGAVVNEFAISFPPSSSRSRQASESASRSSNFSPRPGYGSGLQWPLVRSIDVDASRKFEGLRLPSGGEGGGGSFFVNDLSSISPTSYKSTAQSYYQPMGLGLRLGGSGSGGSGGEDRDAADDASDDTGDHHGLVSRP